MSNLAVGQATGKSDRELAGEMNLNGMNIKEVSIALGVPYGTVYGWLRESKAEPVSTVPGVMTGIMQG